MSSTGFVNQAYRDMVNWPFYHDVPVRLLFDHLLRMAAWEEHVADGGILIPAGGMLIQIEKLAKDNDLTERQVRFALKKLMASNEITMTFYSKRGSLVIIKQWEKYIFGIVTQLSPNCHPQSFDNQIDTNNSRTQLSPNCHSSEKIEKINSDCHPIVTQLSPITESQITAINEDMNKKDFSLSPNCHPIVTHENSENEEIPPIPPKEDKDSKEKNINININKKEKSLKITFNFDTNAFENITDADMALWRKTYPAIDIQQEINKAACWLVANPTRVKSNYKKFLNSWLCKAQDRFHPNQPMLQFPQQSTYGRPTESKPFDPSKYTD